jgi:hypothetical protein
MSHDPLVISLAFAVASLVFVGWIWAEHRLEGSPSRRFIGAGIVSAFAGALVWLLSRDVRKKESKAPASPTGTPALEKKTEATQPIPNPNRETKREIEDAEDEIESLPDDDLADRLRDFDDRANSGER